MATSKLGAGRAFVKKVQSKEPKKTRKQIADAKALFAARNAELVELGRELDDAWLAITGEQRPRTIEELEVAAVRYGISPDTVISGRFTYDNVYTTLMGKMLANLDHRAEMVKHAAVIRKALEQQAELQSQWSEVKSPSEWATQFGISTTTLKRMIQAGDIRIDKITTKRIRVHRDDVNRLTAQN